MLRSNQNFSAQRLLVVGSVLVAVAVVMVSGGIIPFENRQLGENANQYSGSFFRSNQRTIRHHMAMITKDDSHGDIDPFIHFDRMSNHAPLAWFSRCNSHHAGNAHSKPKPKLQTQTQLLTHTTDTWNVVGGSTTTEMLHVLLYPASSARDVGYRHVSPHTPHTCYALLASILTHMCVVRC
jgi:hypothetical protein